MICKWKSAERKHHVLDLAWVQPEVAKTRDLVQSERELISPVQTSSTQGPEACTADGRWDFAIY